MTTETPTPAPLAPTAMAAVRDLFPKWAADELKDELALDHIRYYAATIQKHFQPLLAKVEAENSMSEDRVTSLRLSCDQLRADLAAKEADTAILDWLEAKSKFIISINGTHRGYHELPSVAIDFWPSGGVTAGLGMTPCTLRAAVAAIIKREQSALASRADKGGAT